MKSLDSKLPEAGASDLFRLGVVTILGCTSWLIALVVYSWHAPMFMDEYSFLKNVAHFAQNRTIIPVYARYPTLYSYLIAPFIYIAFLVRSAFEGDGLGALRDATWLRFVFIENVTVWARVARFVTMLFSVATLSFVMRYVAKRRGLFVGIFAALLLVLEPSGSFLVLSSWGLPDIPVAFLVTIVLWLAVKYSQAPNARILGGAAFLVGLAGSMKLNGVFAIFPLLALPVLADVRPRERAMAYVRVLGFVLLGFLVGSPAFLISLKTYVAGFAAEREILTGGGHFGAHDRNWIWIVRDLWKGNAVVALLLGVGVVRCLWRRSKADMVYLSLLVPVLLIVGALAKKTMWYLMLLYPWSAIIAAEGVVFALGCVRGRAWRTSLQFALMLILLLSGTGFVRRVHARMRPDNRTIAQSWIHENIPAGECIVMDWAYVPQLRGEDYVVAKLAQAREAGSPQVEKMASHYRSTPTYKISELLTVGHTWAAVDELHAAYLVTSESVYARFLQTDENRMPPEDDPARARYIRLRSFYTDLVGGRSGFNLVRSFDTGSGPSIKVFKRKSFASGGEELEGERAR